MWCERCRTDNAAEVTAATGRARCATCGADLGSVRRLATDEARELLKRWSVDPAPAANAAREPAAAFEASDAALEPEPVAATRRPAPPPRPLTSSPRMRVDGGHDEPENAATGPRIDPPHAGAPPHFDVHTAVAARTERGGRGGQVAGQILAYAGVLTLTVGSALVIWSYFGGPADYAPTGWLIATGGQMLLFLGVVTLIAGGLEQTGRDVKVHVESLGERLIRIEQVAAGHPLRGPHAGQSGAEGPRSNRRSLHEQI